MSESNKDYFKSPEHELLLKHFTQIESERLYKEMEENGINQALSLCIAVMSFYATAITRLGLDPLLDNIIEIAREGREDAG